MRFSLGPLVARAALPAFAFDAIESLEAKKSLGEKTLPVSQASMMAIGLLGYVSATIRRTRQARTRSMSERKARR